MGSGGGWGLRGAERSVDAFRDTRRSEQARGDRSRLPPRHCWVVDPPTAPGRWPGVVIEWRPSGDHWEGRVVIVIGRGRGAAVLDVWLGEEQLVPM